MAINLDEKYPGRAQPKSVRYPQGAFKNRTAPDSQDGTYLEQDWANDMSGFLQWLLANAGITANGQVDNALASQYAEALIKLVEDQQATETKNGTVSIATQQETDLGNDDTKTVTPRKLKFGFISLDSSNGFIKFPQWLGGLIIQWGRVLVGGSSSRTITFPMQFPSSCYSIVASDSGDAAHSIGITSKNQTNFSITSRSVTDGSLTPAGFYWFSIGR